MKLWSILFLGLSGTLLGQQPSRMTFEVASVKPMPDGGSYPGGIGSTGMAQPIQGNPALIRFNDVSLVGVLCRAYDLKPLNIHAPEWMSTRRYMIAAKVPADAPKGRVPEMLQNFLADRFQMKLHWETKEESGYLLGVAKGGPKLKDSAPGAGATTSMTSNGHLEWRAHTMSELASSLTVDMGRPVVNMTELPGSYDIDLDAAPDSMPGFHFGNSQDSAFPTIFAALRQLGLDLSPAKVKVKYLVVESALKTPTED